MGGRRRREGKERGEGKRESYTKITANTLATSERSLDFEDEQKMQVLKYYHIEEDSTFII